MRIVGAQGAEVEARYDRALIEHSTSARNGLKKYPERDMELFIMVIDASSVQGA